MAGLGFFAGGLADSLSAGFSRNQQADFQQQELKIQQQAQDNAQKRFDMGRVDTALSDAEKHLQESIDAFKSVGMDPKEIAQHVQGTFDVYRKTAVQAGYPGRAEANYAAWMAAPPSTQVQSAQAAAKVNPQTAAKPEIIGQDAAGDPIYGTYNKETQKYEPMGAQNLTGPGKTSDVVSVENAPPDPAQAFLGAMPPQLADEVKGVAEYRIDPNKFSGRIAKGMTQSHKERIIGLATRYAALKGETYDQSQFTEKSAGARTLGTRGANLELAANEFNNMIPITLEASKSVPRTQYKDINNLILAWREKTGDPNVVALGASINSLINGYARAINPTGQPRISDKDHAREILQTGWSQGQLERSLGVLQLEVQAARKAKTQTEQGLFGGKDSGNVQDWQPTSIPGVKIRQVQ